MPVSGVAALAHAAPDQHMAPASVGAKRKSEENGAIGVGKWMAVARIEHAKGKGEGKGKASSEGVA